MSENKAIVCRCEDITREDVVKAIREGYTDLEELRKKLRIGMGPCQGRICLPLLERILKEETGEDFEDFVPSYRPPVVPVSLESLTSRDKHEKK